MVVFQKQKFFCSTLHNRIFFSFSPQITHFPRLLQNVNPPPPVPTPGKNITAQAKTSCVTCKFDISN